MGRKVTCRICDIADNTQCSEFGNPSDLDDDFHEGFTIGNGNKLYWMMVWHKSGNVTVYPIEDTGGARWLPGDQEITIHFKEGK